MIEGTPGIVYDTTPPSVSITAPVTGSTLSNTITIMASASDDTSVAGVQFYLDGNMLGSEDTIIPYSVSWDTKTASNDLHTLTAIAKDISGNSATSAAITVIVDNPVADTTPPIITNSLPTGTLPSNTTSITLSITTNENANCRYSTTPSIPYNSMNSAFSTTGTTTHKKEISSLTNGTHNYYIRCIDASGNANVNDYAITFSIASPSLQPKLIITSPVDGAVISITTVPVTYVATGNLTNVDHIHLQLDNNPEVRDLDFNGNYIFANVSVGNHTLKGYLAKSDHLKIGNDATARFTTLNISTPTNDTDNDGILDLLDKCPFTKSKHKFKVSKHGCPLPIWDKFSLELTTNFSNVDLKNFTGFKIGIKEFGQIDYRDNIITLLENISISADPIDLERIFDFLPHKVIVRSHLFQYLNLSATITLFNITNITSPRIMVNGVPCTDCKIISFKDGNLIFTVKHWTEYSVEEGSYCGDTYCSGQESCSSCPNDCGSCVVSDVGTAGGGGSEDGGDSKGVQYGWGCTEWSQCTPEGIQTRSCSLVSGSGPPTKPEETRGCVYISPKEKPVEEFPLKELQPIIEQPTQIEIKAETKAKLEKSKTIFISLFILFILTFLIGITILRFRSQLYIRTSPETNHLKAVTNYINMMRAQDKSDLETIDSLLKVGWDKDIIDGLLKR